MRGGGGRGEGGKGEGGRGGGEEEEGVGQPSQAVAKNPDYKPSVEPIKGFYLGDPYPTAKKTKKTGLVPLKVGWTGLDSLA